MIGPDDDAVCYGGARPTDDWLSWSALPAQQFGQLNEVRHHAPRLVAREQVRRCTSARLVLEVEIAERLTVLVTHNEACGLRRSMAAGSGGPEACLEKRRR